VLPSVRKTGGARFTTPFKPPADCVGCDDKAKPSAADLVPATPQPSVVPFSFDGAAVRVVMRDGEPWFVLADVCKVLDISNSRDASARLDEDEKADVGITDTSPNGPGQRRTVTAINESGLYSLVLTSRKPDAKRFKKWITSEVIPSMASSRLDDDERGISSIDTPSGLMMRKKVASVSRSLPRRAGIRAAPGTA
jgi:prophage antirepressor-like protein